MSARQQGWLEVQTKALQGRLDELSWRTFNDFQAFSTTDIGELARQAQLQAPLEGKGDCLAKRIRQRSLSLETAVSAQLMDFGAALRQRTEAHLQTLQEASIDLVKRQSEALKASLKEQLGCLGVDILRQAQCVVQDELKTQRRACSPVSL